MTFNAKAGHNSGLEPAQERAFLRGFPAIKEAEASMASKKGEISGIYKNLENAGIPKSAIKFAKELEKKNVAEVIATLKLHLAIARVMGHQLGRQFDLLDKDRTPLEDAAYLEGLGAGRLRKPNANPYGMETTPGQAWQRGHNDGSSEANAALAETMDDVVKAGSDDDFTGDDEGGDETADEDKKRDDEEWTRAAPDEM